MNPTPTSRQSKTDELGALHVLFSGRGDLEAAGEKAGRLRRTTRSRLPVETVDRLVAADGPGRDGLAEGGLLSTIAKDGEGRLVTVPDHLFAGSAA